MRRSGAAPAISLTRDGGLPYLNYSQILEWMKCRYRYDLGTNRHIHSRTVIRPLEMGSANHIGMEAALRYITSLPHSKVTPRAIERSLKKAIAAINKWAEEQETIRGGLQQMTEEERAELHTIRDHSPVIVGNMIEYLDLRRWRTLKTPAGPAVELGMLIPFPGWGGFHATVDWAAEDLENGGEWLIDYKFRKSFTPDDAEEINLQMGAYQYVLLEKYGIETTGSIMLQGKSSVPNKPKLNKDGSMSRQAISTTWEVYEAALVEAGLDPDDYIDMQIKLGDNQFFRKSVAYRSPDEITYWWNNVIVPAGRDLRRNKDKPKNMYRSPHYMNCIGCWARQFCLAEVHGDDTEFLLQTRYIDLDNPQERLILSEKDIIVTGMEDND